MKKPNFFIVGAPKCGTTALSEYLRTHLNVFISTPKEPHYFAHDFPLYKKYLPTLDDYMALFANVSPECSAVGEASVWYLYSNEAIKAVYDFAPNARVIVMLRNPIELVQSIHSQLVWVLDENVGDFATAWRLQERRKDGEGLPASCREPAFLQYGEVAKLGYQVERLLDIFPREQVKILFLEDMKRDTGSVYREVLDFLGLKNDERKEFPRINENKYNRSKVAAKFIQRPPPLFVVLLKGVKRLFGIEQLKWRQKLQNINANVRARPVLDKELQQELIDFFRDDVRKLQALTGRDLSSWLKEDCGRSAESRFSDGSTLG